MKKLITWILTLTVLLTLPSLALAKGKGKGKKELHFGGKVTAFTATTLTVEHGKKANVTTKTITVPTGTSITDDAGTTVAISDLVGKHVQIKESAADTAQSIVVKTHKGGKGGKKKKNQ